MDERKRGGFKIKVRVPKVKRNEENRIRNRKSYQFYKQFLEFLNTNPTKSEILRKVHAIVNAHYGYGSATNSGYAKESIEQLIKDYLPWEAMAEVLSK